MLIAIPSWLATDDPLWAASSVGAATVFLITTSLLIFNDHTWFNPDETEPPAWHEIPATGGADHRVAWSA